MSAAHGHLQHALPLLEHAWQALWSSGKNSTTSFLQSPSDKFTITATEASGAQDTASKALAREQNYDDELARRNPRPEYETVHGGRAVVPTAGGGGVVSMETSSPGYVSCPSWMDRKECKVHPSQGEADAATARQRRMGGGQSALNFPGAIGAGGGAVDILSETNPAVADAYKDNLRHSKLVVEPQRLNPLIQNELDKQAGYVAVSPSGIALGKTDGSVEDGAFGHLITAEQRRKKPVYVMPGPRPVIRYAPEVQPENQIPLASYQKQYSMSMDQLRAEIAGAAMM